MAMRCRDAAARRQFAIPAHLLDIGAGQRRDVAARLVVARAFGDDGRGRVDALGPVEREAKAVAHLAGTDLRRGEAAARSRGPPELFREPGRGRSEGRRGGKEGVRTCRILWAPVHY